MNKESILELQLIDCNCNDCKFMQRDFEAYKSHDNLYKNSVGQVTNPSYRVNYGNCSHFNKPVTFIPNICQPENQSCFKHRKL